MSRLLVGNGFDALCSDYVSIGLMSVLSKSDMRKLFLKMHQSQAGFDVITHTQRLISELNQWIDPCFSARIAVFYPHQHEPNLLPLYLKWISQGHELVFPFHKGEPHTYGWRKVFDIEQDFIEGYNGILEPKSNLPILSESDRLHIDYWIVPGLLFDRFGGRLGRGQGIYDRELLGCKGIKMGVGFDWQMVLRLPMDSWDIAMDRLVTPTCTTERVSLPG